MSDDKLYKYIEANKEDKQSNSGNTATIAVLDKPKTKNHHFTESLCSTMITPLWNL